MSLGLGERARPAEESQKQLETSGGVRRRRQVNKQLMDFLIWRAGTTEDIKGTPMPGEEPVAATVADDGKSLATQILDTNPVKTPSPRSRSGAGAERSPQLRRRPPTRDGRARCLDAGP